MDPSPAQPHSPHSTIRTHRLSRLAACPHTSTPHIEPSPLHPPLSIYTPPHTRRPPTSPMHQSIVPLWCRRTINGLLTARAGVCRARSVRGADAHRAATHPSSIPRRCRELGCARRGRPPTQARKGRWWRRPSRGGVPRASRQLTAWWREERTMVAAPLPSSNFPHQTSLTPIRLPSSDFPHQTLPMPPTSLPHMKCSLALRMLVRTYE